MILAVASTNFSEDKLRKTEFTFWLEVIESEETNVLGGLLDGLLGKFMIALEWTKEDEASHIQMENYQLERVEGEDAEANGDPDDDLGFGGGEDDPDGKGGAFTMRKRAGNIISKLAMHFSDGLWKKSEPVLAKIFAFNTW